jgi:probable HAF family extracellular repeat protein
MRAARKANRWITAWGLTFFSLGIVHLFPAHAQQDTVTDSPQGHHHKHHHYQLIDLGTFGGPASYFSNGFDGILNNQGVAVGWADTYTPDPYPPFCFSQDCFVSHAFQTRNGVVTDLGVLPGGLSSQALWITANGLITGNSQNGQIDPLFSGFPENRAVLWQNGTIVDLGTLPEGGYESFASTVNSRSQVVGFALNTIPDPFSLAGPGFFPTQTRAFLWQDGMMQDLGTLGGSGAFAFFVNERGQIAGQSYTNSTPNPVTGLPTADPFLWENGTMQDLGSLGGTLGNPTAFNNRGQVVGVSNLAGDLTSHPFLWTTSQGMKDLGTLGGDTGFTNWINDAGEIAGKADVPGPAPQNHDAVLWQNGVIIDLGALPGDSCANAYYVNARGQVVGTSESRDLCLIPTGEHAFLRENGGPMVDLNSLIPPGSSLQLTFAVAINDRGEIAGFGVPAGCAPQDVSLCGHAYVLIPCDENHPEVDGCDFDMVDAVARSQSPAPRHLPSGTQRSPQSRGTNRYHIRRLQSPSRSFGEVAPEG